MPTRPPSLKIWAALSIWPVSYTHLLNRAIEDLPVVVLQPGIRICAEDIAETVSFKAQIPQVLGKANTVFIRLAVPIGILLFKTIDQLLEILKGCLLYTSRCV